MLKKYTSPLYLVLYVLITISLLALSSPSFSRNIIQLYLAIGCSLLFDYVISFFLGRPKIVPISSFISGLGIFFLFESVYSSFYVVVAFLAIASKFVLRINNKHIFNPTSLALLIVAFGYADVATINVIRWQAWGTLWSIFFILTGIYITKKVDRWVMPLSFSLAFIVFALIKSVLFNVQAMSILLPISGAPLHLFIFFMLTDPKTTPSSRKGQAVFSVCVALLDSIFRYYENRLGILLSLVAISLLYSLYLNYYRRPDEALAIPITN